jgi:threonine synthase
VVSTNSPAMDIQAPYNIERVLRLLDPSCPAGPLMEHFYQGHRMTVPSTVTGMQQHQDVY